MPYNPPGNADSLPPALLAKWNETLSSAYNVLEPGFGSRFFAFNPTTVVNPTPVPNLKWFASPAEPVFCLGQQVGRELSDWNWNYYPTTGQLDYHGKARELLHNEYCEYVTVMRQASDGRWRPKRVIVTTELREYWVTIAMHDPDFLRQLVKLLTGSIPDWNALYGIENPQSVTAEDRERLFSIMVAGHGNHDHLKNGGVPAQPTGTLNRDHALFMTHPINGLDDLYYIVMFGAHPYAASNDANPQKATKEQIFREFGVEQLACRHADPAAAIGAHNAAFSGKTVAFEDPLGMYIRTFKEAAFTLDGAALPSEWIQFSRGSKTGLFQRLEFGPPDNDSRFLGDIQVTTGGTSMALEDGYQVVQQMEVGPAAIATTEGTVVQPGEYRVLTASSDQIVCSQAAICQRIRAFKSDYDRDHPDNSEEIAPFALTDTPNRVAIPKRQHSYRYFNE